MKEILDKLENPHCGLYFDYDYDVATCTHCGITREFVYKPDGSGIQLIGPINHLDDCLMVRLRRYFERGPNS